MAEAAPLNWNMGCTHYKRNCKLVAPCCGNIYSCRFCHDEKEKHQLDRKSVKQIICNECCSVQTVRNGCNKCGLQFGKYTCLICKLFDNEDKGQFHCHGCGICRVGGREAYFHCKKCNFCLRLDFLDRHKCVEDASRTNCHLCLEDVHSSRDPLHVPPCFHLLHQKCLEELKASGIITCSLCQKNLE